MFSHLVESEFDKGELRRKGYFFLATMAAYALILMAVGVVGVYAYEARIDNQNLELVALVPPDMDEPQPKTAEPKQKMNTTSALPAAAQRRNDAGGLIKNTPSNVSSDLTKISGAAQSSTTQTPPVLSDGGGRNLQPGTYSPFGSEGSATGNPSNTGGRAGGGIINEEPPKVVKKQAEPKQKIPYIGPVNSKALSLPDPAYPPIARAAGVQGVVTVEILIDETGRVISARAASGHPFLKPESEKAAMRARFSPTTINNQPVKAKGVITFNFILRK